MLPLLFMQDRKQVYFTDDDLALFQRQFAPCMPHRARTPDYQASRATTAHSPHATALQAGLFTRTLEPRLG